MVEDGKIRKKVRRIDGEIGEESFSPLPSFSSFFFFCVPLGSLSSVPGFSGRLRLTAVNYRKNLRSVQLGVEGQRSANSFRNFDQKCATSAAPGVLPFFSIKFLLSLFPASLFFDGVFSCPSRKRVRNGRNAPKSYTAPCRHRPFPSPSPHPPLFPSVHPWALGKSATRSNGIKWCRPFPPFSSLFSFPHNHVMRGRTHGIRAD